MKKKNIFRILIALFFVGTIIVFYYSGLRCYLSFDYLNENRDALLNFVEEHFLMARFCYILIYVLLSVFFIPFTPLWAIFGGFIFGFWRALIYVVLGAVLGAIFAFLITRHVLGNFIQKRFKHRLEKFNIEIKRSGAFYLFVLRFSPFIPFVYVNLIAGVTKLSFRTYLWATILGVIPISLVYIFAGGQFSSIRSSSDIMSWNVILALLLLVFLSLLPIIVSHLKNHDRFKL